MRGALQALLETHHSTDVLPEDAALERMNQYKLIVVPEEPPLDSPLLKALQDFARGGGYVLVTGAELAHDYSSWVGATPRGEPLKNRIFLPLGKRAVPVGFSWQPVSPAPGTTSVATPGSTEQDSRKKFDQPGHCDAPQPRQGRDSRRPWTTLPQLLHGSCAQLPGIHRQRWLMGPAFAWAVDCGCAARNSRSSCGRRKGSCW